MRLTRLETASTNNNKNKKQKSHKISSVCLHTEKHSLKYLLTNLTSDLLGHCFMKTTYTGTAVRVAHVLSRGGIGDWIAGKTNRRSMKTMVTNATGTINTA